MKVGIVEMYLKEKAYIWFHGFIFNHPNIDWDMFTSKVCRRFAENNAKGEDMEMETNETRDPIFSNVNHQENETEVISALKFEGESNGNVIFF